MITETQHSRLIELHKLIRLNGMSSMTARELNEFGLLMSKSLEGKGDIYTPKKTNDERKTILRPSLGV